MWKTAKGIIFTAEDAELVEVVAETGGRSLDGVLNPAPSPLPCWETEKRTASPGSEASRARLELKINRARISTGRKGIVLSGSGKGASECLWIRIVRSGTEWRSWGA